MGHVFGNAHVPNTIMDDDIAARILDAADPERDGPSPRMLNELLNIDGMSGALVFKMPLAREARVRPRSDNCAYTSGEGRRICEASAKTAYDIIFKRLTDRDRSGSVADVEITLRKQGKRTLEALDTGYKLDRHASATITLKDAQGEVTLRFNPISVLSNRLQDDRLFLLPSGNSIHSDGVSVFGSLETPSGKKRMMVVNYNIGFEEFELIDPLMKVGETPWENPTLRALGCSPGLSCPLLNIQNYID